MSQDELALAVGASVRAVGDWENDRRKPRNRLGALEQVLGVNLSGTGPGPPQPPPELAAYPDLVEDIRKRCPDPEEQARVMAAIAATLRGESPSPEPGTSASGRSDGRRAG